MPVIPGVTVKWPLSPRVIIVPVSETQVTVVDGQDTLQDIEDSEEGIIFQHLRETSGGEDLGGGTSVGWTMEMQNSVWAFAPRTTVTSSGTITTTDANGETVIDSGATFITDGVVAGANIINFTDQSVSSVISVDSETQLTTFSLGGGTDNQWGSSDVYKVFNVEQCELTGGNFVAVNDVDASISPALPTFGTQILRTSSSSATNSNQQLLEYSSFGGYVTVDVANGEPGTGSALSGDPLGTEKDPVNNITDAISIASARGFKTINFKGDYTFVSGDNVAGYELHGEAVVRSTFTFNSGSVTLGTEISNATIQGTLGAIASATHCTFKNVTGDSNATGVTIDIDDCIFDGTVTLSSGLTGEIDIINCSSGVAGQSTPIFDLNNADVNFIARGYSGGMEIRNITAGQSASIDIHSGQVRFDSSCTSGTVTVRGDAKITDNSVGLTVIDETTPSAVWDRLTSNHSVSGSFGEKVGKKLLTLSKFIGLK